MSCLFLYWNLLNRNNTGKRLSLAMCQILFQVFYTNSFNSQNNTIRLTPKITYFIDEGIERLSGRPQGTQLLSAGAKMGTRPSGFSLTALYTVQPLHYCQPSDYSTPPPPLPLLLPPCACACSCSSSYKTAIKEVSSFSYKRELGLLNPGGLLAVRLDAGTEGLPSQWAAGYVRDRILQTNPNMRAERLPQKDCGRVKIRTLFSDSFLLYFSFYYFI